MPDVSGVSPIYTFADLGGRGQPLGQCRCGRAPTVAQFAMSVREYKPDRKGLGKQHGSLTRALCEACAVELFVIARDAIREKI